MNRYAYVNYSPLNNTDPSGHKCIPTENGSLICQHNFDNQSLYNRGAAAQAALDYSTATFEELNCPYYSEHDTRCTCLVSKAINIGFALEIIPIDDVAYFRAPDLLAFLSMLDYSAVFAYENLYGSDQGNKQVGDGNIFYGVLDDDQAWITFIENLMFMGSIHPGDIVFYQNADVSPDVTHAAMVFGFAEKDGVLWPLVVDIDGGVAQQPHFIDATTSEDIHAVIIVSIRR